MTKADIQKRQLEIMTKMDEMDEKTNAREAKMRALTSEEQKGTITDEQKRELEALKAEQRNQDIEYDALVRESAGLSARAKAMATGKEMENIREREDYGAKIREMVNDCFTNRRAANATTILANAITGTSDDNEKANLQAGGLIPVEIRPIIDTKVPGIELPEDLVMVTGVTGTQVIPYSINDVKFTVEGEVTKVAEQALDFANITTSPKRVAASVPVSRRAVANAAFDIIAFITYKFQKGWAMFRALHIYAHGNYAALQSPFAQVTVETLTLDENIGKNLAKKVAEMYDLGFEGDPEIIMDKTTEVDLKFTKLIPGTTDSNRTVIQDGQCVGYRYHVSPYIDYSIDAAGVATKGADRYIGIGHFGYLNEQVYADGIEFNIDGTSSANFDRNVIALGMGLDYSLVEMSSKVNGKTSNKPQAFKLIKLVKPASSNEIGD
ncbi:MAG: phage major capsid protein [Bacteroidaceae bacterium]|nr:phage major capsid protein [Bacteroidaceae bacterium]